MIAFFQFGQKYLKEFLGSSMFEQKQRTKPSGSLRSLQSASSLQRVQLNLAMTKDFALRQQAFDERGPQQAVIQDIAYMFAVIACTCTMSDIPQHWKIILHPSITENDQKRDRAPLGPLGLSTLQAIKTVLIMVNDGAWLLGRRRSCSHGMPWFTTDTEVR